MFHSPFAGKRGNVPTIYNGEKYRSKKEAAYAAQLDLRVRAGDIFTWRRGQSIFLKSGGVQLVNPKGRRMYYRPDFEVTHLDGRVEIVEVKGRRDTGDVAYKLYWLKREIVRVMGVSITEL